MLTGPLLSMLRFICVEGRKKKEKPAKTKAEFLLQLFETINEPRCDVVGCFFYYLFFFFFISHFLIQLCYFSVLAEGRTILETWCCASVTHCSQMYSVY